METESTDHSMGNTGGGSLTDTGTVNTTPSKGIIDASNNSLLPDQRCATILAIFLTISGSFS